MNWPIVKLSEVCSILSGFAFKSNYFGDSGIPLVRIRDVMRGFSETYYSGEYDEQFVVNNNDILIGMDGDFNIAKWAGGEALLNQRVCRIIPDLSVVDADYLFYFLPLKLREIWDETAFVTVKHLSVKKINDIDIPLPELSIQKDISAMLRVSDSLRNQSKKIESDLNALSQAVFLDMFGDPLIPNQNNSIPFGNILDEIESGWSPRCEDKAASEGNWGVLKLSSVTKGTYQETENKQLPTHLVPRPKVEVKNGDLLFTRKNTKELVAAVSYVRKTRPKLMLSDLIFRFKLKSTEKVSKVYLYGLFSNQAFRENVQSLASGAAGSMPNISKAKLWSLNIPLPSYQEQVRYESIIFALWDELDLLHIVQKEYMNLFDTLMQRSFCSTLEFKNVA
ncbi:restriction endonuclease subunit S [Serratia ureilytica]|uniref:restriction endonuclease subunit S n=1 Tax=Serratia ureilytica TaxID=300181 RepID=UPI0018D642A4|nr:restriction endonuclease subunit S [Serratia ureilytica]